MKNSDAFSDGHLMEQLADKVYEWGEAKGITKKTSSALLQVDKLKEEVGEIEEALEMLPIIGVDPDKLLALKLEIGDAIVVLMQICRLTEVDMVECLEKAYYKISQRTGQMKHGVFVKD